MITGAWAFTGPVTGAGGVLFGGAADSGLASGAAGGVSGTTGTTAGAGAAAFGAVHLPI
jgi:hypothetical protein